MTLDEFRADGAAVRAAAYSVQIISEAIRHIPDEWLGEFPDQPWAAIKATGNKIRHEYFRLDEVILWQVAIEHSITLKDAMEELLEQHGNDRPK